MHFQKKWNLFWSPDELVQSIWSWKIWDLWLAEKFRKKISNHLHQCVDHEILPKTKKIARKKESIWGRYRYLKILVVIIFPKSWPFLQKSKGSRFCFRCPIWMKQNLIWGFLTFWIWCKYQICTSKLQSSPTKYLSYRPDGQFFQKK